MHINFDGQTLDILDQCISFSLSNFKTNSTRSFLYVYIITNHEDAASLTKLCNENQEPIPHIIVYPFATNVYDDLEKDAKSNLGAIEALQRENPTIANVLIDYFDLHKYCKLYYDVKNIHNLFN